MGLGELLLLAVGVSMDAFAVSICKGLAMKKATLTAGLTCGIWFGGFQALMPLIGYFLGVNFAQYIVKVDHWITLVLLVLIGANMIKESREEEPDDKSGASLAWNKMLVLAIATSIDAFAVGITIALLKDPILISSAIIGIVAFLFSIAGVFIGRKIGHFVGGKFQILGGVILILIGVKILLVF